MDASKLTTRSQGAVAAAIASATSAGNPVVEPVHLLQALLVPEGGTAASLLSAAGVDHTGVRDAVSKQISALPSARGDGVQAPQYGRATLEALQRAADLAGELGDDFVSSEHLLVGIATAPSDARTVLIDAGATADILREAFDAVRGSSRVTSQNAEDTYQSLEKYGVDLTAVARDGGLDPVIGRDAEIRRVVQLSLIHI